MTTLSDLDFVPQTFRDYVQQDLMKRSRFFNSGAVVPNDLVFPDYGSTVTVPAWDGLGGDAEVLSDSSALTLNNLDSSSQVAPIMQRGKLYGHNDLVASFTGSDPMGALGQKIGSFWQRDHDAAAVNAMVGAAEGIDSGADTVINDMATAAIDIEGIIDARALFGEYQRDAGLILVLTPADYAKLNKDDVVDALPGSGVEPLEVINGMPVIVSSTLPANTAALVRQGAFFYSDGTSPEQMLEEDRDIAAGTFKYSTRMRYVIHPVGAKWVGTPAGATATNAELATAGNWEVAEDALRFGVRLIKHSA